jgi:PAS domain S-box-containing protein
MKLFKNEKKVEIDRESLSRITGSNSSRANDRILFSPGGDFFQLLANSTTDVFWMTDENHKFIYFSEGVSDLYGLASQEALCSIEKTLAPESALLLQEAIGKRLKSLESGSVDATHYRLELKHYKKDGSEFWTETNSVPYLDLDGNFKGVLGFSRDITEKKNMEIALARRVKLERLACKITSDFLGMSLDQMDAGINDALRVLGEFTQVDRSYVFTVREGTSVCDNIYEWCAESVDPQIHNLQELDMLNICPYLWETLGKNAPYHIPDVSALPEGLADREILEAQDICSVLIVPMSIKGRLVGFLGFDSVKSFRKWSEEDIDLLLLFSQSLALFMDRQQAEQALIQSREDLRENQEKLDLAISMSKMGIWEDDLAREWFTFNDQFYALYGTTAEQEGGYSMSYEDYLRQFVPQEDISYFTREQERISEDSYEDGYGKVEHRIIRRDGQVRDVAVRYKLFRDSNGVPVKNIGVNQDITEQKNIERKLRKSEERFSNALDAVNEGVWEYWVKTGEIYFNSVCYTMLGYKPDELEPTVENGLSLIHPDEYAFIRDEVFKCAMRDCLFDLEVRMRTSSDGWRWVNAKGRVVEKDDSGLPVRIIGTNTDITERKKYRELLIEAKERAEAANKAKSEFLTNMSHEIRTPLNGIVGMLQLLHSSEITGKTNEYIESAITSSRRLSNLLGDILQLSSLEAGNTELNIRPLDVGRVLKSIEKLFYAPAQQAGVLLYAVVDKDIPPVLGDEDGLRQVFKKLVGNAIKFTDKGYGFVSVEAYLLPTVSPEICRVYFQVSDEGIGIPEEKFADLFTPFAQGDSSSTKKYDGAGLGLSVTKKYLDMMGARVSISSEPGVGTVFGFSLEFPVLQIRV